MAVPDVILYNDYNDPRIRVSTLEQPLAFTTVFVFLGSSMRTSKAKYHFPGYLHYMDHMGRIVRAAAELMEGLAQGLLGHHGRNAALSLLENAEAVAIPRVDDMVSWMNFSLLPMGCPADRELQVGKVDGQRNHSGQGLEHFYQDLKSKILSDNVTMCINKIPDFIVEDKRRGRETTVVMTWEIKFGDVSAASTMADTWVHGLWGLKNNNVSYAVTFTTKEAIVQRLRLLEGRHQIVQFWCRWSFCCE